MLVQILDQTTPQGQTSSRTIPLEGSQSIHSSTTTISQVTALDVSLIMGNLPTKQTCANSVMPSDSQNCQARYLETLPGQFGFNSRVWCHYATKYFLFQLRLGPTILCEWNEGRLHRYKTLPSNEGYTILLASQSRCLVSTGVSLIVVLLNRLHVYGGLSMTLSWKSSTVVPETHASVTAARVSDITSMQRLFELHKAVPDMMTADGNSLLHVSVCLIVYNGHISNTGHSSLPNTISFP